MQATQPWGRTADAVAKDLASSLQSGLASHEAVNRLQSVGPNRIEAASQRSAWKLFVSQFLEVMVALLAGAAVISGLAGEWTDAVLIGVIVLANAVIGFAQEWRAEQALAALRKLSQPTTRVRRDGELHVIPAEGLVPGDVVEISAGDIVPADLRIVMGAELEVDESALTGESLPVAKSAEPVEANTLLPERTSMLHSGTPVVRGRGTAIATATGMRTELGSIARLLESAEAGQTPLQKQLASLSRWLAVVVIGISVLIFAIGVLRESSSGWSQALLSSMLLTSVSLAVAAIPEGLPAIITVTLALGSQRMAARNAIIRRLSAVETLGSVDVICSDKTGTLTQNRMTVRDVLAADGAAGRDELLLSAVLNSEARLLADGEISGAATERALLQACVKAGLAVEELREKHQRLGEIPFSSKRKRMTTLYRLPDGGRRVFVKGAAERVLELCRLPGDSEREHWLRRADELAANGRRVLAFAARDWNGGADATELQSAEADLTLLGLVGLIDPPRPEAAEAIAKCRSAGIFVAMITGDHPGTAAAVGAEIGISDHGSTPVTGELLERLGDEALADRAAHTNLYARVSPEHKLRIVRAHQSRGRTVAMTGDGVNDAPALKQADIGVAMGVTGTEVSKEAAAMVLADDNFATIVAAVEEGRVVYDNIRKFVTYLLTANAGEVLVLLIALVLGWPLPLAPVHLLWINLVTDGLPALALGFEIGEKDVMQRPPRKRAEGFFTRGLVQTICGVGLLMAVLSLVPFAMVYSFDLEGGEDRSLQTARTLVFYVLAVSQLFYVLAVRSFSQTILQLGFWSNYRLAIAIVLGLALQILVVQWAAIGRYLHTTPLSLGQLLMATGVAAIPALAVESWKWLTSAAAQMPVR